jgi:hypothetical protein
MAKAPAVKREAEEDWGRRSVIALRLVLQLERVPCLPQ